MGSQGLGLEITELRLGLPGGGSGGEKKRTFSGSIHGGGGGGDGGCGKNRNMDEVVGWPPVCVFRKKSIREVTKLYVKVSMDGAPILRKIDLSCFKCYSDLGMALEKLFDCYGIGEAMKEESESCEYVAIYEDKDRDWMLVGDVPWSMFTETCKRLRIKKRSNATGIGPVANV
ncbi:auxin-induced protein IAA6 [Lactuca sativa]|uniref:auxin-induced protein IAA6 n=1 Tax=Lactuca sativa TaxID=4236 RepID=UPI0022AE8800|nr:auxin-induced protein IAA6 [Lactuca sativa]